MEELLNKLIRKGWNPFGWYKHSTPRESCNVYWRYITFHCNDWDYDYPDYKSQDYNIRELVSKESWLWQFVYDNWYNQEKKEYREWYTKYNMKAEYWDTNDYEYYIIESALCNEEDLEQFLLDNIKVKW